MIWRPAVRSTFVAIVSLTWAIGFAAASAQSGSEATFQSGFYNHVRISSRPYTDTRMELERLGLRPVRLKHSSSDLFCWQTDFCRRFPEVVSCAADGPCAFAFVRTRDDRIFLVLTNGESELRAQTRLGSYSETSDVSRVKVSGIRPAIGMDLAEIRSRITKVR
jgi:hypothetical protein